MPTKVKGMTSIEIAVLVAIILAIAVAAAWYLYSTFSATVGASPTLSVVSANAFPNGTIRVDVINTGSSPVIIYEAYVFDRRYSVRGGYVYVGPTNQASVFIDTGVWTRMGSIIQGNLVTERGHVIPFSARCIG